MGSRLYGATICYGGQNSQFTQAVLRFRKSLFVDQLGWDLNSSADIEFDGFDRPDTVYCALHTGSVMVGGFRAIPTDTPYLAKDVFPQLAVTRPFPERPDYWEISRFGVSPRVAPGRLALLNYAVMFRFAQQRQIKSLVALVELNHERYLTKIGIRSRRYGPPMPIGRDARGQPIEVVAGEIPVDEQEGEKFRSLLGLIDNVEIKDEALILGRESVSA